MTKLIKRVIIESPFTGDLIRNIEYAKIALTDSIINHEEAAIAFHLLYPQVLDDSIKVERTCGLLMSKLWLFAADLVAVYHDFGISNGMQESIDYANKLNIQVEYRRILKESN